jgi:uroporphyrinogen decarboxylase
MYIKDFADIGLDIIGQQIGFAKDMEPEKLKNDFGDIITFWGGMDTQRALVHWTPTQVKEWTKKCIRILSPGYIVASNHTIERDTPPENIWAVHEAIEEMKQSK